MKKTLLASSLSLRLKAGFGCMLVLLMCLAGLGLHAQSRVGADLDRLVATNAVRQGLASDLMINIGRMATEVRNIALLTSLDSIDKAGQELTRLDREAMELQTRLRSSLDAGASTPEEHDILKRIVAASEATRAEIAVAAGHGNAGDNSAAVTSLNDKVLPAERQWRAHVDEFTQFQKRSATETARAAQARQDATMLLQLVLVLVSLVFGSVVAWRITRSVVRPLGVAVKVAESIAQGDLSTDVPTAGADETGRLLEAVGSMQERLRQLVGRISVASGSIDASSAEVAAATQDLSNRTELASQHLQSAASSLAELTEGVDGTVESAARARELAAAASQTAVQSGDVISRLVHTMDGISESSRKISEIISIIDGIAFQTNVLALNAAVEAARAGNQGRGFAVVASEVRSLAGKSAVAAREIKALIGDSAGQVKAGAELVSGAGGTIHSLVSSVKEVAELIEQISTTMAAQGHSINSVAQVVSVIDGTVQENAAMVEESAAASSSLREQANALAELMRVFKLETPPSRSESSAGTYSIGTSASPLSLVHRGTRALPVPTSAH